MNRELLVDPVHASEPNLLAELDRACFEAPWGEQSWRDEHAAANTRQFLGRTRAGQVVAYASVSLVADEAEIRRIAVLPEHRRQGFGHGFLVELLAKLKAAGARHVYLEVRASNAAARALYAAVGFVEDRIRAGYYRAPPEDGVDLSRGL